MVQADLYGCCDTGGGGRSFFAPRVQGGVEAYYSDQAFGGDVLERSSCQANLDYTSLKELINKLESIC